MLDYTLFDMMEQVCYPLNVLDVTESHSKQKKKKGEFR